MSANVRLRFTVLRRGIGAIALMLVAGLGLAPDPLAAAGFQAPVRKTLPNGMRVVVFARPGSGVVQAQLRVDAGAGAEAESQRGVAVLAARMVLLGTSSRDANAFGADLDRLGGRMVSTASRENAVIGMAVLPGDLESGMELLSDAVINPVFDDASFERTRTQAVRELVRFHRDPAAAAEEQLWPLVLPGVPEAHAPLGDLASLFQLNRDAVRNFHRDHYRPDRAVLAVAGDVTPERAFAVATEWFGRWSGHSVERAAAAAPAAGGPRILLVDAPQSDAAGVRLGWALPGRDAEDNVARGLGTNLIEEGLQSRLAGSLARGGGLDVALIQLRSAGLFGVGFVVPVDSAGAAITRAQRAVRQLRDAPPDPARVTALARQVSVGYPMRFETLAGTMSQWFSADDPGADADAWISRYPERVAAVTPAEVAAATRRGWSLDQASIVVVGPAARLRSALARLGPVREIRLDEPPSAEAAPNAMPAPTAEEEKQGRYQIRAAIRAHGGLDKLRSITDSAIDANIRLTLEGRELSGRLSQVRKEPMKMVYRTVFETVDSRQVLNGSRAWTVNPAGQLQDADSLAVRAMQGGFLSDVPHILLAANDSTARLAYRGKDNLSGQPVWVVDMESARGRRRLYFDPMSALLVGIEQGEGGAGGLTARRLYRDVRETGGVKLPFEEERQLGGKTVMHMYIAHYDINRGVADEEFQRPASMPTAPGR